MALMDDPGRRGVMVVGALLVFFGVVALVGQALSWDVLETGWPLFIVATGIVLFAAGVAVGGPGGLGFAIPGGIVTMVGLVITFQAATDLWATWAYAWGLVAPGGVGLGMVLYGLVTRQQEFVRSGTPPLLVGLGLFLGFGLFFEGVIGLNGDRFVGMETALAAGLVLLGLAIVAAGLLGRRRPTV